MPNTPHTFKSLLERLERKDEVTQNYLAYYALYSSLQSIEDCLANGHGLTIHQKHILDSLLEDPA
jgi:hypothetical protein